LIPAVLAVAFVCAALPALMPSAAEAGPLAATLRVGSKEFPSGALLPGGEFGTITVAAGPVTLTAPEYVYELSKPPGTLGTVFEFMFWDIDHTLYSTERATFVPAGTLRLATAWYLPVCVVSTSCGGGGVPTLTTWAFSLMKYKVLAATPIASVTPSTAWTSPSTHVSTSSAVSVTAQSYLGAHTLASGSTTFGSWFVFGAPSSVKVSALDLTVPAGVSPYAIAFYNQTPPYHKPICIGYPTCI
jgi:hypothetical protein